MAAIPTAPATAAPVFQCEVIQVRRFIIRGLWTHSVRCCHSTLYRLATRRSQKYYAFGGILLAPAKQSGELGIGSPGVGIIWLDQRDFRAGGDFFGGVGGMGPTNEAQGLSGILRNGQLGIVQSEQFTCIVPTQPFLASLRGLQHFESTSVLLPE